LSRVAMLERRTAAIEARTIPLIEGCRSFALTDLHRAVGRIGGVIAEQREHEVPAAAMLLLVVSADVERCADAGDLADAADELGAAFDETIEFGGRVVLLGHGFSLKCAVL